MSSIVTGFFGLSGVFLGCGTNFFTGGSTDLGAIDSRLTGFAIGFSDKVEGGISFISGVALTVGSGVDV